MAETTTTRIIFGGRFRVRTGRKKTQQPPKASSHIYGHDGRRSEVRELDPDPPGADPSHVLTFSKGIFVYNIIYMYSI